MDKPKYQIDDTVYFVQRTVGKQIIEVGKVLNYYSDTNGFKHYIDWFGWTYTRKESDILGLAEGVIDG